MAAPTTQSRIAQPGGPHGPLERRPLEDGDVRLARASSSSPSAIGGAVGTKTIDPNTAGPGESGRMDRILDAGFKQPAGESVLIQSDSLRDERSRLHGRDRGRRRGRLGAGRGPERPLAARPGERRPDREGRARRARRVRDPRRRGQGGRQDRAGPRPGRRGAEGPPAALHRRVRRRERGQRGRDGLRGRPREGRPLLAPDHADHPRGRVRSARGGGHPAAARADRRLRDVRAGRAAEPGAADGERGRRARAPDRARGRRRLLDVLLEAGTRGAGRRAQRAGGARGRRGDVRPLGAGLRPDRDGRDGRHVPDRRRDVRLVRRGDDHRRRDGDARLADRAARAALASSATRSTGCASRSSGASAATTAKAGSGARSSTASCGGPVVSAVLAGGLLLALARAGAPAPDGQARGRTRSRSRSRSCRPTTGCSRRSPARRCRPTSSSRRRTSTHPRCATRSSGSSSGRSRAAGCTSRSRSTSTRTRRSRTSRSRSTGTGTDDASIAALERAARGDRARRPWARSRTPSPASPGSAAQWKDSTDQMKSKLPLVVAFVLVFAFGLMLVAFRSIVVAAKAIVLNLLSVAAAYGVLVIVFQHGFAQGPARLQLDRRDRPRRAAAAVRDPVRPLDGLPRPRDRPDPRGVQPRRDHGRRDLARDQAHGRRRHERGRRDGRRLLDLRRCSRCCSSSSSASGSRRRS